MAKKRISDVLIEVLANAGIERIYGITGDSLNSVNDSLRRNGKIAFEHVRHEETAAFAAGAATFFAGAFFAGAFFSVAMIDFLVLEVDISPAKIASRLALRMLLEKKTLSK